RRIAPAPRQRPTARTKRSAPSPASATAASRCIASRTPSCALCFLRVLRGLRHAQPFRLANRMPGKRIRRRQCRARRMPAPRRYRRAFRPIPRTDPLQLYREKRDFRVTREPPAKSRPKRSGAAIELGFVIHKQASGRLHYGLRLELDCAMKSWAVPNGSSLDPDVKRMVLLVEGHSLDYADFEGTIPPKQYGAGTVILW